MAIYTIEADGKQFDIEGPDNATQDELQGAVNAHLGSSAAPEAQPNAVERFLGLPAAPPEGRNPLKALGEFQDEMSRTGEQMTEELGKRGVPAPISAAVGMVPTFLPDAIAGSVMGPGGRTLQKGTKLGRMLTAGDIVTKTGLKSAGEALGEGLAREGVALKGEILDTPRTAKAITEYAQGLNPFVKAKASKIAEVMEPAQLNRLRVQIGDILDNLNVAKQGKEASKLASKTTIANLAKIKEGVTEALQIAKPALRQEFQNFAGSKGRQAAVRALGRGVKTAAKVATGAGLAGSAIKYLFH